MPVVLEATPDNIKNLNCEIVIDNKHNIKTLNEFKKKYKGSIWKEAKRCKCDTLIIDIENKYDFGVDEFTGGGCIIRKGEW